MTDRKTQKDRVRPTPLSRQDPDAYSLPTGRQFSPITYRVEIVAVSGREGEALFKNQQTAILNALRWAAANTGIREPGQVRRG